MSGIVREYKEPYKCDILSEAEVVAAATLGWEGGVRTVGRQCSRSERRRVLQELVWFCLVSKAHKLL